MIEWLLLQTNNSQIMTAGLIAFAGVVLGLITNGLLQWGDRASRRRHERKAMRSALVAELSFLLQEYDVRVFRMSHATEGFNVPTITATQVFDSLLERIGLLTPEQGRIVIHAYLGAKHLLPNLRFKAFETAKFEEPIFTDDYVRVAQFNVEWAMKRHEERIDLFKRAIRVLGGVVKDEDKDG
jgi:hypothetical protein